MFLLVCFPHYTINEHMSSPINNDVVNSVSFIKTTREKDKNMFFFQLSFFVDYNMYVCQLDSHDDVYIGK